MARTWDYTWRNRLPLALIDAVGGVLSAARSRLRGARSGKGAANVRRILVIEFWNIGDVVLATPFLAQLRSIFPGAEVTLLAQQHAEIVMRGSDLVDEVIVVDFPWTHASRRYDPTRYDWSRLKRVVAELRSRRFDIAFESRMDPRAKLVLALSGARRRVAYSYGGCNWLITDALEVGGFERHRSDDWLRLLEPFGGASIPPRAALRVTDAESGWAREWLRERGIGPANKLVAVHPGASMASKRWPLERFAAVVREAQRWPGVRVVAIEDPGGYGAELSRMPGVCAIRPTLRELMAILAAADALVCNDSGPMHVAAALGTPTVGIFHSHAASEFAPLGPHHAVLAPRHGTPARRGHAAPEAAALLGVEIDDVSSALRNVLVGASPRHRATG